MMHKVNALQLVKLHLHFSFLSLQPSFGALATEPKERRRSRENCRHANETGNGGQLILWLSSFKPLREVHGALWCSTLQNCTLARWQPTPGRPCSGRLRILSSMRDLVEKVLRLRGATVQYACNGITNILTCGYTTPRNLSQTQFWEHSAFPVDCY